MLPNIKELSLFELIYYDDFLPTDFHQQISEEITNRTKEISDVLNKNESDYHNFERILIQRLKYIIEQTLWTYFVEGHKELYQAYSQIGIVSDDPYSAAEQFQSLVRICFPTKKIQQALQNEVNKFYKEINDARIDFYQASGKKYADLSYTVPAFSINSIAPIDPLKGISEARERYIRNREDVSTGTSILGWMFGGVVGLISQGIGDWMAIDGLVSSEFSARKAYMTSVQQQTLTSFVNYSNKVLSGIEKTLKKS